MGKGNWAPAGDVGAGCLVYVDACAVGGCDDGPCECGSDFRSSLRYALGAGWHWCAGSRWGDRACDCDRSWGSDHGGRTWASDRVLASSEWLRLVVDADGDPWHAGVSVCVAPGAPALARVCAERSAARLWRTLAADGWQLSVRTSAWTSAPHPACIPVDVLA